METNRLHFIFSVFSEAYKIPMIFINEENQIILQSSPINKGTSFVPILENLIDKLVDWKKDLEYPIIRSSNLESFIILLIKEKPPINMSKGAIIAGPIINQSLSDEWIQDSIYSNGTRLRKELYQQLFSYYDQLPTFSDHQFIHCALHLYYMVYGKILDSTNITYENLEVQDILINIQNPNVLIANCREQLNLHHDIIYEQRVMQAVREGKKEDIPILLRSFPEESVGTLSKDSILRSKKNLAIAIIAIAVRAAMDGGLHYEVAYTLSDLYIQAVEQLHNPNSILKFLEDSLIDLAERVQKSNFNKYSRHINKVVNYIYLNLNKEVTLEELASVVHLHPNYLSSLIKKEIGMPLREFIQRQKVDEAKKLLLYSDYPLSKIAGILNYNDQSHFTRTFKKYTALTPNQFRNYKK